MESFGDLLRRYRLEAGLTQEELAERARLSRRAISDLERGQRTRPWRETVQALTMALGLAAEAHAAFAQAARRQGEAAQRDGSAVVGVIHAAPVVAFRADEASIRRNGDEALPPPRARFAHNLPVQLTSFVGREREIADVRRLLDRHRLLTLTGSGGCGKTRLALELAREVLEDFPDGVWMIELAPLADPSLVPAAIASALGISEVSGRPLLATLVDYLRNYEVLLVIDNCEHVIDPCARAVETLLQACARLRILATSRERLGVAGEASCRVPSLSVVDPRDRVTGEDLARAVLESEAGQLFVDRARLVAPAFEVSTYNAAAVAEVCRRLSGIPLALELAAARLAVLAPDEIAARLDQRFRLLTGGNRTALRRQQTLQATIDWSYQLLSDDERALLRRLAVFSGDWALDAAESVCAWGNGDIDPLDVLDLLTRLAAKSMIFVNDGPAPDGRGERRFQFLETIREYAKEKLREAGEVEMLRNRHRDWFVCLAEQAMPALEGPDQQRWFERLEREHDNLRTALAWCAEGPDGSELLLRLAAALGRFWLTLGYLREGDRWLELALETSGTPRRARACALAYRGNIQRLDGNYERAGQLLDEGIDIARAIGDHWLLSMALRRRHFVSVIQGERDEARRQMEEALAVSRAEDDKSQIAYNLCHLGGILVDEAPPETVEPILVEAVSVGRESGDIGPLSESLVALGRFYGLRGDHVRARDALVESLELSNRIGNKHSAPVVLMLLGDLARAQGDMQKALDWYRQALHLHPRLGRRVVTVALRRYAGVCAEAGQRTCAARLFGSLSSLSEQAAERISIYRGLGFDDSDTLRSLVGDPALTPAWAAGEAMTLEQAVAYTLSDDGSQS